MATRTISTRLAIEGEAEYKQKISEVNQTLKTLGSELALVEAKYKEQANTTEALYAKAEVLGQSYARQAQKVKLVQEGLEAARRAQDTYAQSAADLGIKIAAVEAQLENLKKGTADTTREQAALEAELKKYKAAQAEAEQYHAAATRGVEGWTRQLNNAEKDLIELQRQIEKTDGYLDEAEKSTDSCAASIDKYGKEVKRAGDSSQEFGAQSSQAVESLAAALAAAGVTAAFREIVQSLKECIGASTEFESAITGVFKTVEGTPEQLAAVSEGIRAMSLEIPSTTTEIAAVAEAAGQLGIATDDVLSFTRTMLDLGQSTNLSAEEAASALAKFANITGTAAEDYGRLGSVIVGLGNNFATTEADIVSMAMRLASTGALTGLSEANIMALATALSSVGIEAEAGGSAISKLLKQFEVMVATGSPKLADFARVAGMSAEEFSQAWGRDAVGALSDFIVGLGSVDAAGGSSVAVLDELGITETRLSNAVLALASSGDLLTRSVSLANSAWEENTALADEANKRYATTESQLAILDNSFTELKRAVGDVFAPAVRQAAEGGSELLKWATDVVEEHPWVVSALSAVTAALGALTLAVTGYTLAVNVVRPLIDDFNLALAANPAGMVAVAIGVLVAALGGLILSSQNADNETRDLIKSLDESKQAYEETAKGIQSQADSIMDMVAALESSMEQEEKTAAEKASILELVTQLNEAVPELSLAYDEQADSLNLTADAVRNLAQAEADRQLQAEKLERLVELRKEDAQISEQLEKAKAGLSAAEKELAAATKDQLETAQGATPLAITLSANIAKLHGEVDTLTERQAANAEESARLEGEYNSMAAAADDAAGAVTNQGDKAADAAKQLETLSAASDELTATTKNLTDAQDVLTDALKEQKSKGSLTLDTTLKLIDAGYSAALSIDNETGAITLNKDAYISIAQAKIEAQIATIEAQKASVDAAIDLGKEAYQATETAVGYLELARARRAAKAEAADESLNSLKDQSAAYDAQIAALKKAQDAIGSYTYSANSAARSVSSSAKKAKTQAEKDMEAYKEQKAELDHLRAVDEVDDEAYYTRLAGLRDDYLTDDSNLTEYRKVTEQIFKYDEELAEAEEKLHEKQLDEYGDYLDGQFNLYDDQMKAYLAEQTAMIKELEDNYKAVMKEQQAMAAKLADYGDLFTLDDKGKVNLEDLEEQTKAIREYGEMLSELKARGISGGLLNEIIGMGVDDASAYGAELLEMSDKQFEEYSTLWEEKNLEAARIAEQFYKDQLSTIQTQYEGQLQDALSGIPEISFDTGVNLVQGLIDGMQEKQDAAMQAARELAEDIENTIRGAWDIHSPSKVMAKLGGYAAQGLAVGFEDEIAKVQEMIARSVPTSFDLSDPSAAQRDQTAALVNAVIGQQNTRQSWDDLPPIHLEATFEMDSEVVAQKTFVYNAREAKMHGQSMVEKGL